MNHAKALMPMMVVASGAAMAAVSMPYVSTDVMYSYRLASEIATHGLGARFVGPVSMYLWPDIAVAVLLSPIRDLTSHLTACIIAQAVMLYAGCAFMLRQLGIDHPEQRSAIAIMLCHMISASVGHEAACAIAWPTFHAGSLISTMLCTGLAARLLDRPSPAVATSYAALVALAVASDRSFVIWFCAPLVILLLAIRPRHWSLLLALTALFAMCGQWLTAAICSTPQFDLIPMNVAFAPPTLSGSITGLYRSAGPCIAMIPLWFVALLAGGRPTGSRATLTYFLGLSALFACTAATFTEHVSVRYLLPLFLWIGVATAVAPRRPSIRLVSSALAVVILVCSRYPMQSLATVPAACRAIDATAPATSGLAHYWVFAGIAAGSATGLKCGWIDPYGQPRFSIGGPHDVGRTIDWIVIDGLDPVEIERVYGRPSRVTSSPEPIDFTGQGGTTIWWYDGGTQADSRLPMLLRRNWQSATGKRL